MDTNDVELLVIDHLVKAGAEPITSAQLAFVLSALTRIVTSTISIQIAFEDLKENGTLSDDDILMVQQNTNWTVEALDNMYINLAKSLRIPDVEDGR